MADKPAPPEPTPAPEPTPVVVANTAQQAIPMMQIAPDGVTPVELAPATPPSTPTAAPQAAGTPVHVTVNAPQAIQPNVTKGEGQTLAPTTTEAQDLIAQGQRDINQIWEKTQKWISLGVTFVTVGVISAILIIAAITGNPITQPMATLINHLVVMTTLILSFYFSRTNHEKVGGVGPKPEPPYQGR